MTRLKPEAATRYHITPRQAQVLGLMCGGLSAKEIARVLGICHSTAEMHTTDGLHGLGCTRDRQGIAKLYREGLVDHDAR